jgi:hypothetical protein
VIGLVLSATLVSAQPAPLSWIEGTWSSEFTEDNVAAGFSYRQTGFLICEPTQSLVVCRDLRNLVEIEGFDRFPELWDSVDYWAVDGDSGDLLRRSMTARGVTGEVSLSEVEPGRYEGRVEARGGGEILVEIEAGDSEIHESWITQGPDGAVRSTYQARYRRVS